MSSLRPKNAVFRPKKSSKLWLIFIMSHQKTCLNNLEKRICKSAPDCDVYYPRELETSLPSIGEFFGGRDHTTVIHAIDKIERHMKEKSNLKQEIELIKDRLYLNLNSVGKLLEDCWAYSVTVENKSRKNFK
jgi:hypothetical protein